MNKKGETEEVVKLRQEQRKIREQMVRSVSKRLRVIFSLAKDRDEWMTIKELACNVFKKTYSSVKDERIVYEAITMIRWENEGNDKIPLLICARGCYGYATDKEEIDNYSIKNVRNGLDKIRRTVGRLPGSYLQLGIKSDPMAAIGLTLKAEGFKMLEKKD